MGFLNFLKYSLVLHCWVIIGWIFIFGVGVCLGIFLIYRYITWKIDQHLDSLYQGACRDCHPKLLK